MSASQTLLNPPPNTLSSEYSLEAENSAVQGRDDQPLPPDTIAALGVLGEDALTHIREKFIPSETNGLSEAESLKEIIAYFEKAKAKSARISDNEIYDRMESRDSHDFPPFRNFCPWMPN